MRIRVFNYNTMEKVKEFEAHTDYIRCLAVHPTLPLLLSSSDDMFIKLWDWEKNWECLQVFDGHTHYVMQVEFNPKDTDTFASGSLDRTVKVLSDCLPHRRRMNGATGTTQRNATQSADGSMILTPFSIRDTS